MTALHGRGVVLVLLAALYVTALVVAGVHGEWLAAAVVCLGAGARAVARVRAHGPRRPSGSRGSSGAGSGSAGRTPHRRRPRPAL